MKENVLDVLMYLFENYMYESQGESQGESQDPVQRRTSQDPAVGNPNSNSPADQDVLASELAEAGFARGEISKAFSWLEGLAATQAHGTGLISRGHGGIRHYNDAEQKKLDAQCRGFLHYMESAGALDVVSRELVMDRVMALDVDEISLEHLRWVTWMVLYHRSGRECVSAVYEDLIFEEHKEQLH